MSRPWQPIGIQPTQPHGSTADPDSIDVIDRVTGFSVQLLDRRREYRLAWDADRLAWVVFIR